MISYILIKLLKTVEILVVVNALLSWIPISRNNEFITFIHNITEPILQPARNIQQRIIQSAPVDFSPVIVLILLEFIIKILH